MKFDPKNPNQYKSIIDIESLPKDWPLRMEWAAKNKPALKSFYEWVQGYGQYIQSLYKEYQKTSNESEQFEIAAEIVALQRDLINSGYASLLDKKMSVYNHSIWGADLDNAYENAYNYGFINNAIFSQVASDVMGDTVNAKKNASNSVSITVDDAGNPVISGRVPYYQSDLNLSSDMLKNAVSERLNDALKDFFANDEFTTTQKINALSDYLIENPSYSFSDSNLTKVITLRDRVYSAINKIASSTLTQEEKIQALEELGNSYTNELATVTDSPIKLNDMWEDFGITKDLSDIGLSQLAVNTSTFDDELKRAMDMYISNKSIYDNAIKNYEEMVKSYTPEKIQENAETYGDIASKYNGQKLDKQVTDTAKAMGQSDAIATQLGNQAQYQNYAENLTDNQMAQTENAWNVAQNDLDNQYTKVQNAYNNAVEAEGAMMGENDKKNAEIQAMLTQAGVDLATDKYNYDRAQNKVQLANSAINGVVNAANTIKGSMGGK